ncbi:MAG: hypothetical protein AAGA38_08110 [Pseudomonadota bacterium]
MNKLLAAIGFFFIAAFLGILGWKVQEPDLMAVIVLTLVLVAFDFASSARDKKD